MYLRKKIMGWFRRYSSTNLFHKQLDFCFTSDFLCIIFQVKFSLCKWSRNIYLVLMYFIEKLKSSVAIFGDLAPLIAIIFITFEIYVDQCLVKFSYSRWSYLILARINTPNCLEAMERKLVIVKRKYWTICIICIIVFLLRKQQNILTLNKISIHYPSLCGPMKVLCYKIRY